MKKTIALFISLALLATSLTVALAADKEFGANDDKKIIKEEESEDWKGFKPEQKIELESKKGFFGQPKIPSLKDRNENEVLWNINFGEDGYEGFEAMERTSDGGYVFVGTSIVADSNDSDIWAVKIDSDGEVVWDMVYVTPGEAQMGYDIEPADDGGFVIMGQAAVDLDFDVVDFTEIVVMEIDCEGEVVWTSKIGEEVANYTGNSLIKNQDGGYVIFGSVLHFSDSDYVGDLMEIDSEGNLELEETYEAAFDRMVTGSATSDGGYIFGAFKGDLDREFWVVKIDEDKVIEWERNYGNGEYFQELKSIKQTSDGGYIATGASQVSSFANSDVWVLRIDNEGGEIFNRTFGRNIIEVGKDVIETVDGGFAVIGFSEKEESGIGPSNRGEASKGLFLKLDEDGEKDWSMGLVLGFVFDWNFLNALYQTEDGDYIMVGTASEFETGVAEGWSVKISE